MKFKVDNHAYDLFIDSSYEVILKRLDLPLDGAGYKMSSTGVLGDTKNPLKVVRKSLSKLYILLKKEKPPYFQFSAIGESRQSLYKILVDQINKHSDYQGEYYYDGGYYLFVKK